ncbi:hypothetical protein GW17_00024823 [Ensete ventricosum]|nr:hypothetical protein GW17_00024823 [Ensete ventricosum]
MGDTYQSDRILIRKLPATKQYCQNRPSTVCPRGEKGERHDASGMHYAYRSVPGTVPYRDKLDTLAQTGIANLAHHFSLLK